MEHLEFVRVEIQETERRKRRAGGFRKYEKDYQSQGGFLEGQIDSVKGTIQQSSEIFNFQPHLLLKITLEENTTLSDPDKEKLSAFGIEIIDEESRELLVLFSDSIDVPLFAEALSDYKEGKIAQTKVAHQNIFSIIKSVEPWSASDRVKGLEIEEGNIYYDVYMWVFNSMSENREKLRELKEAINQHGIRICDEYISSAIVMLRVYTDLEGITKIKEHTLVYQIQNIPKYNYIRQIAMDEREIQASELLFDNSNLSPETSTSICVIDCGIFKGHPLFEDVIGDSKVFFGNDGIDDGDNSGHGTIVASICAYGEITHDKVYTPDAYILNAKIHDGMYEDEFNMCINELRESGYNLTFEQQIYLQSIYNYEIEPEELLEVECFSSFTIEQKRYLVVVVTRYLGVYEKLIPNQMREIVEYFHSNYNCRIFNLSQGDLKQVYQGGKPNAWSCVLDDLQHEYDIMFVVSSGNGEPTGVDVATIQENYPTYLFKGNDQRVIEPANSVTSVVVGSIATSNTPLTYQEQYINPVAITDKNQLSSTTRVGYGNNKSLKPDFIAYGGDGFISNAGSARINYNQPNRGLSILGFGNSITGNLFSYGIGSSFSAPYVSNLAAKLLNNYPKSSMNLVRALLALSANVPDKICTNLKEFCENIEVGEVDIRFQRNIQGTMCIDNNKLLAYTAGYGFPDVNKLLSSRDNRVVVFSDVKEEEDALSGDSIHIYKLPIFESYRRTSGKKIIEISVAFNPEVRKTRLDYVGNLVGFDLVRGKSFGDVYDVYKTQKGRPDEEKRELFKGKFRPKSTVYSKELREKGTLQKYRFEFSNSSDDYGDDYYVVVNANKRWSDKKIKYAIAVNIETLNESRIYEEVKRRVQIPVRERVRR